MILAYLAPAFIAGALGRRIAGGLLTQWLGHDIGTQPQRLLWGATAGATVWACGQPWWVALAALVGIWAGSCLFGYALPGQAPRALLMGHQPGDPEGPVSASLWWQDMMFMTYHGIGGIALLTIAGSFIGLSPWWLTLAGLLCGPSYALAYVIRPNVPVLGMLNQPDKGLVDPPPAGEFLWGGLIGMALVLTCLA